MKSITLARVGLAVFCLIIIAGSSVPGNKIPEVFELTPDKLIHCVEYFVLGLLIHHWLKLEFPSNKNLTLLLITILLGSLFGIIDENYQRLTPGRSPDTWDWVLDTVGVSLSVFASNLLVGKINGNKKDPTLWQGLFF